MSIRKSRFLTSICLILTPFVYISALFLYGKHFEIMSRIILMGWIALSLAIGIASAMTFRFQIFSVNIGTLLSYSPAVMIILMSMVASKYKIGEWFALAFFVILLIVGIFTIWKNKKSKCENSSLLHPWRLPVNGVKKHYLFTDFGDALIGETTENLKIGDKVKVNGTNWKVVGDSGTFRQYHEIYVEKE